MYVYVKRLAKIHGGTDKALRVLFEWADPAIATKPAKEITDKMQRSVDEMVTSNQKAAERQQSSRTWKRGPRPKGDKTR